MTDEYAPHFRALSSRVDELHEGHVELKGKVNNIDDTLNSYIESRSAQLKKDQERRIMLWSWAKIALWIIGIIVMIIVGSLGTSTYAILDGLWRLKQVEKENARQDDDRARIVLQHQEEAEDRRSSDTAMWSVLNSLGPTVSRIDERTEQMDGRMRRLEARQDRQ